MSAPNSQTVHVPVEPTPEMMAALEAYYAKWQRIQGKKDDTQLKADCWSAYHAYKAMIAAAPQVPGGPSGTGVVSEVTEERRRQDEKWGGAEHDDGHSTEVFVQLIEDYAGWARVMAGMYSYGKARRRLIQVAALAVAAVESIDRQNPALKNTAPQAPEAAMLGGKGGDKTRERHAPTDVVNTPAAAVSEAGKDTALEKMHKDAVRFQWLCATDPYNMLFSYGGDADEIRDGVDKAMAEEAAMDAEPRPDATPGTQE